MGRPVGSKTKKVNPKPSGPRFTLTERERLKTEVTKLDLHGFSQRGIAEKLDTSPATINTLLAEINEDYKQAYVDDRKRWVMKATAAHLDVIRECQEQIAKLKERGKKKLVEKRGTKGEEEFDETAETTEDAMIDGYLVLIQKGWVEIAALHGLKELPAQIFNVQVNNNTINVFDRLLEALLAPPPGTMGAVTDLPPVTEPPL